MRFEIVGSPDHENALESYTFAFRPTSLDFTLVEAKRFQRSDEYANWRETSHWHYPDLLETSTMDQPECPDWAIADAKTYIIQKIHFKP